MIDAFIKSLPTHHPGERWDPELLGFSLFRLEFNPSEVEGPEWQKTSFFDFLRVHHDCQVKILAGSLNDQVGFIAALVKAGLKWAMNPSHVLWNLGVSYDCNTNCLESEDRRRFKYTK